MKELIVKVDDAGVYHIEGELIRCKDCKHHKDEKQGMVYCPNIVDGWVEEECYCSWAEPKETE